MINELVMSAFRQTVPWTYLWPNVLGALAGFLLLPGLVGWRVRHLGR